MRIDERLARGRPGLLPKWTSSAKVVVGTALTTASRVWFTLSHGISNEVGAYLASLGPPPRSVRALWIFTLVAAALTLVFSWWSDRHRVSDLA